jgi:hypothetical protein
VPDHAMIAEMNARVAQEIVAGGDGAPQPPQQGSAYQAANYHLMLAIYHQLLSMTDPPAR